MERVKNGSGLESRASGSIREGSMKRMRVTSVLAGAITLVSVLVGLSAEAPASLRYMASGLSCTTASETTDFSAGVVSGYTAYVVMCPVPLGQNLVNLTGSNQVSEVRVTTYQSGSATVLTSLYAHDGNSSSWCNCGDDSATTSGYKTWTLDVDCGSCPASDYALNAQVLNWSGSQTRVNTIRSYN